LSTENTEKKGMSQELKDKLAKGREEAKAKKEAAKIKHDAELLAKVREDNEGISDEDAKVKVDAILEIEEAKAGVDNAVTSLVKAENKLNNLQNPKSTGKGDDFTPTSAEKTLILNLRDAKKKASKKKE
jgi:hypothetical protein